jgi:hypothetical protein
MRASVTGEHRRDADNFARRRALIWEFVADVNLYMRDTWLVRVGEEKEVFRV